MKGYFISEDNARALGLFNIDAFAKKSQKTIIVITENDVSDISKKAGCSEANLGNKKINEMSSWFYRNYYEDLIESFKEF